MLPLRKDDSGSVGWVFVEMIMALVAAGLIYLLLSVFYSEVMNSAFASQTSHLIMNNTTVQGFNVLAYAWQNFPLLGFIVILAGSIIMAVAYRLRAA